MVWVRPRETERPFLMTGVRPRRGVGGGRLFGARKSVNISVVCGLNMPLFDPTGPLTVNWPCRRSTRPDPTREVLHTRQRTHSMTDGLIHHPNEKLTCSSANGRTFRFVIYFSPDASPQLAGANYIPEADKEASPSSFHQFH